VHVVLAGGGTAGHIEPALALADALRRQDPTVGITALGTERGLETRLVPERGYELALIPAVPLPRKPTPELITVPGRLRGTIKAAEQILERTKADAVVGFGGYVALPGYLAAKRLGPVTTEILDAPDFYFAEDYHQQYLAKNPFGYCGLGGTGVSCPVGTTVAA